MEQKITAGRDELGGFAPKFAQLNAWAALRRATEVYEG